MSKKVLATIFILLVSLCSGQTARAEDGQNEKIDVSKRPDAMVAIAQTKKWIDTLQHGTPAEAGEAAEQLRGCSGATHEVIRAALSEPWVAKNPMALDALQIADQMTAVRERELQTQMRERTYILKWENDCYDQFGQHDPKWDHFVKQALDDIRWGGLRFRATRDAAGKNLKAAKDAGCNDPLVDLCIARLNYFAQSPSKGDATDNYLKSLDDFTRSHYPKDFILLWQTMILSDAPGSPTAVSDDDYKGSFFAKERPDELIFDEMWTLEHAYKDMGRDFSTIAARYIAARPKSFGAYDVDGENDITMAWRARGTGYANTVTDKKFASFDQDLELADAAFSKAWELNPNDSTGPTEMLQVCLGRGDRETMEKWFSRAMVNNPDNNVACEAKLYWLYPRWNGSHAEMIRFGHECLTNKHWLEPLMLVDAQQQVATDSGEGDAYLSRPEVWADTKAGFVECLKVLPKDQHVWCLFAQRAVRAKQWKDAAIIMKQIGDKPDLGVFGSLASYHYMQRKVEKMNAAATQPGDQ